MVDQISREENYFDQIDDMWRGKAHRSLSPLECDCVMVFFDGNIPLTAVLLGIERTFMSFKPLNSEHRIRSLQYCVPEILRAAYELYPDQYWEDRAALVVPPSNF